MSRRIVPRPAHTSLAVWTRPCRRQCARRRAAATSATPTTTARPIGASTRFVSFAKTKSNLRLQFGQQVFDRARRLAVPDRHLQSYNAAPNRWPRFAVRFVVLGRSRRRLTQRPTRPPGALENASAPHFVEALVQPEVRGFGLSTVPAPFRYGWALNLSLASTGAATCSRRLRRRPNVRKSQITRC